ncbi:MAG: zinc-dependent metalloprotease [Solirubrobacteraceae bacterium]
MVDWRVARRIATNIAGDPDPLPVLPGDLIALCADAERIVSEYAQLEVRTPLPSPESVSRAGWAEANLGGMRGVLDPLAGKIGKSSGPFGPALQSAGGLVLGAEVGGLVGFLAQRVLGQYEVPPTDPERPARLLFVAPNLQEAAERMDVDAGRMLHWVALHEVTHAVQFSSVTWLRGHVASLVTELGDALEMKMDFKSLLRLADTAELRAMVQRLRTDGVVGVARGPERRALMDRIQATMALIEGHAEHVMDAAGEGVIEGLPELRSALEKRRHNRPPFMRVVEKLMGLEMKMRQYETGKRFCDAVVEQAGIPGLNRAWASPETLPTWAEMEAPETWLQRV